MQSREPVCHILIRLRLIQDEENLLEMKIGHWLAKLYMYHVQCNFWGNSTLVEHSRCGVIQVRGDVLQCIHLCLGFAAAGCASSTDIKTVLRIAIKSLRCELEKFYFRACLGQILASWWILGQGQVAPIQKSPKWGSWKTYACWVWCMQKPSRWRKQKGTACYAPVGPGAFSRKCACHQILAEELMWWLKSW